jgi:primary-amine oxidase
LLWQLGTLRWTPSNPRARRLIFGLLVIWMRMIVPNIDLVAHLSFTRLTPKPTAMVSPYVPLAAFFQSCSHVSLIQVEGVSPLVDLDTMTLIRIDDTGADIPLPPYTGDYANAWRTDPPKYQTELKKYQVVQPDGPSYKIEGNVVTWLDWKLHVGFNPREGACLNMVTFAGRPVLYRLSLSEMIVPYSYPKAPHSRKNAFDVGEGSFPVILVRFLFLTPECIEGVGNNAKTLRSGCDCIGTASFMSASLCASNGSVTTLPDIICVHEEDSGILWKHTDWRNNRSDVRRSRALVVGFWATVANYDYSFNFKFFQDGTVEMFSELTGILSTVVLPVGVSRDKYGQLVAPRISATYHQHFFVWRIDTAIDGWKDGNSVYECDSVIAPPGPANPLKNLFDVKYTPIKSESDSGRVQDQTKFRHWVVFNPNKKTELGLNPGYAVMPWAEGTLPFHDSDSFLLKRAPFLSKAMWVTKFSDAEKYPAGKFPNQQEHAVNGMTTWVQQNRSLENTDVVLWYTLGFHHIPRPEEWPIMPACRAGWKLLPYGFFARNPCYNAPPQTCEIKSKL